MDDIATVNLRGLADWLTERRLTIVDLQWRGDVPVLIVRNREPNGKP